MSERDVRLVFIGVLVAIIAVVLIFAGGVASETGIVGDCNKQGQFRHNADVYTCSKEIGNE